MLELLNNIWAVYLDMAFWLLLGLFAAGMVKTYISEQTMQRWLGGRGISSVMRAAIFGAPLPLCSCGVLPAAIGVRRSGASKEATVSFLISTPETSIDSIAVTYALMGPVMAIYRPIAALVSAIVTGMMTLLVDDLVTKQHAEPESSNCCSSKSPCCGETLEEQPSRLFQALRFGGAELMDDISKWLFIGIVTAGVITTIVPPGWLAQWGSGLLAMIIMLLVGVPMYICASASTPIAASLLLTGVSPGTVLVFLLVGPATNIAGIMLVNKELGSRVTAVYLLGISVVSIAMGMLLDWMLASMGWVVSAEIGNGQMDFPQIISLISAVLLMILAVPMIRRRVFGF